MFFSLHMPSHCAASQRAVPGSSCGHPCTPEGDRCRGLYKCNELWQCKNQSTFRCHFNFECPKVSDGLWLLRFLRKQEFTKGTRIAWWTRSGTRYSPSDEHFPITGKVCVQGTKEAQLLSQTRSNLNFSRRASFMAKTLEPASYKHLQTTKRDFLQHLQSHWKHHSVRAHGRSACPAALPLAQQ